MNKATKWLVGLVTALVAVNLVLIAVILFKKDDPEKGVQRRPGDAREVLITTLSLTDAQVRSFDSLRKGHFETIRQYQEKMMFAKDRFFQLLTKGDSTSATYLSQKIGELQSEMDLERFRHFYQLRLLLNEKQTEKFDETIQDILRSMAPKGGRPEGPPTGRGDAKGNRPPPHPEHPDGKPMHDGFEKE